MLRWAAGLGAVTADALAAHERCEREVSARARLAAAQRDGLTRCWRLLRDEPPLYTVTRAGLRAAGVRGIAPGRVSAGGAAHAVACCRAAARLETAYPDHRVLGEPAIRAELGEGRLRLPAPGPVLRGQAPSPHSHRPDLVLVPQGGGPGRRPIAVEIELTAKAPDRLEAICRAWARERSMGGTIYIAAPGVVPALARAVERARAADRILILQI